MTLCTGGMLAVMRMVTMAARGWCLACLLLCGSAHADTTFMGKDTVVVPAAMPLLPTVVRQHAGVFNGQPLRYRSVVEEVPVRDDTGAVYTTVGSFSYLAEGAQRQRPIVFAFNGGPGSSSIWLHMGMLGPVRPDYGPMAGDEELLLPTVAPFRMQANPESPLDKVDVVLVDPPGTGYARVRSADNLRQVMGPEPDARAIAGFIRDWLQRHGRQHAPVYLLGESYGTLRAALVSQYLAEASASRPPVDVRGLVLVGQFLDKTRAQPEVTPVLDLIGFAATAWYHGRAGRGASLEQHAQRARVFAAGPYMPALFAGSRLTAGEEDAVANELASLIGIPAARLRELGLRIDVTTFLRELLSGTGLQAASFDSRFTFPLVVGRAEGMLDDAALSRYLPMYAALLKVHLRENLGTDVDRTYNVYESARINTEFWKVEYPGARSYADVLAGVMHAVPEFRVLFATGYYDLVTSLGEAEHVVALSAMPAERVLMRSYGSGHMPYLGKHSRAAFAQNIRQFFAGD